jgi:tetratricopeptide (TPR) repeat protein
MHYLLSDIYRLLGRQEKALEHYREYAFAMSEPERLWCLRELARMYEQAGMPDEAAAIRRGLK